VKNIPCFVVYWVIGLDTDNKTDARKNRFHQVEFFPGEISDIEQFLSIPIEPNPTAIDSRP